MLRAVSVPSAVLQMMGSISVQILPHAAGHRQPVRLPVFRTSKQPLQEPQNHIAQGHSKQEL